jgi:diguanylate cyclase (GGDEF)-like protein
MARLLKIAYLKQDSYSEFDGLTINGMADAVRKAGASLIVFTGQMIYDTDDYSTGLKSLYGLIRAARPDGIIANAWLPEVREPHTSDFLDSFKDIPVFLMGEGYQGRPYSHLRGYDYIRELVDHLVSLHNRRRVAFISGYSPDDRDQAYIDYMKEKGLWDESLYVLGIKVRADSAIKRIENASRLLLDQRSGPPPDAILSMNSDEVVVLLAVLRARGISVPDQIALASWEDGEIGRSSDPPITCVEFPYFELGRISAERFIESLRGKQIPVQTLVKTRVFYRKSCGCGMLETALKAYARGAVDLEESRYPPLADVEELFQALTASDSKADTPSPFLLRWESLINRNTSEEADYWLKAALAELRRRANSAYPGGLSRQVFVALEIAQLILDEIGRIKLSRASTTAARTQQDLNQASLAIIATQDRHSALNAVSKVALEIRIPSCWIFLLEDPSSEDDEGKSAESGSDRKFDEKRFTVGLWHERNLRRGEKENRGGSIGEFLGEILSGDAGQGVLIGKILHVGASIQGFALYDPGTHDTRIPEGLSRLISTALNSAVTLERLVVAQDELLLLAENDSLTGLGNRYSFQKSMQSLVVSPPPADGRQVAVMFLDLDGFKPINDSYGHDAGDALLKELASRIGSVLGKAARGIFRVGGDEFTALVNSSGPEESEALAERLLKAVKEPCLHKGMNLRVGASLGCSHFPRDGTNPGELVKFADLSMYRAKETRGSVVVFDRLKDVYFLQRARLAADIMKSVDEGQIEALYQGMFESDGILAGIEALVRWRHPERGLLLPGEFLDIAVANNMIVPIETKVLSLACAYARTLLKTETGSSPFMLVNCTKTFFFSPDFIDIVKKATEESGLRPGVLRLGLEERFAYQNTVLALQIIEELKSAGINFAVEGMGGDTSWISFLRELPADTIVKIDRGFVRNIHTSEGDRSFLYQMLSIFESRGFRVAISGIENESQRELLMRRNCIFQGFALAKPMESERIGSTLTTLPPSAGKSPQ